MKRILTSLNQADHVTDSRPGNPISRNSTAAGEKDSIGFAHLLEHHTVEQIINANPDDALDKKIREFLSEGRLPDNRTQRNQIVTLMHDINELRIFRGMLKLGNMRVSIRTAADIKILLDVLEAEPTLDFSTISMQIEISDLEKDQVALTSLITLVQARGFGGEIGLIGNLQLLGDLPDLCDALSEISNLKLSLGSPGHNAALGLNTLVMLVGLLSKNKTIESLELVEMVPIKDSSASDVALLDLLHELSNQKRLHVFRIAVATAESKELLGKFVENSDSIQRLTIDLYGAASAPSLIKGLKKNTSLKMLGLSVDSIAKREHPLSYGVLPLISLFKKNKCTATELILDISRCDPDDITFLFEVEDEFNENRTTIENLIARNTTLNSLTLIGSSAVPVNLLPIGKGLKSNQRLERMHIGSRYLKNCQTFARLIEWSTMSAARKEIAKNETLVRLTFECIEWERPVVFDDNELNRILSRNERFARHACSIGYLHGAVAGFLITLNIPCDVATPMTQYLATQNPPAATKAIVGVNKASYAAAHQGRRIEAGEALKRVFDTPSTDEVLAAGYMEGLLEKIATTPHDFSENDLIRVGRSDLLMPCLTNLAQKNPRFFHSAKRLSEALNIKISRREIIEIFLKKSLGETASGDMKLELLETTFTPDQLHLAPLIDGNAQLDGFFPVNLMLFVNYDVLMSDPAADDVLIYCSEQEEPELYIAYMENYHDGWLSTDGMDTKFRDAFLSTIPLSEHIRGLDVIDFDDKTDSEAVAAILSDSPLQHLNLVNSLCSKAAFELLMCKLAANTRLKSMEIQFYGKAETFPIVENIKSALKANVTLEFLVVKVPLNHGEQALLAQLTLSEPRFGLETTHPGEVSDDSEDSEVEA